MYICFFDLGLRSIQVNVPNLQGTIGKGLGLSTTDLQQFKKLCKCKETPTQVFSCENCEYFEEYLREAASVLPFSPLFVCQ